jgi:hypothetical protein
MDKEYQKARKDAKQAKIVRDNRKVFDELARS